MLRKTAVFVLLFSIAAFLFPKPISAYDNSLIAQINSYRKSKGLGFVRTDPVVCNFAKVRAQETSVNFSHSGFYNRISNKNLPYPRYHLVTENLAWTPGGQNPVDMWINSPTHEANLFKNTPFICVERHGDYVAFEGWRP